MTNEPADLVNIARAAELAGLNRRTIERWIKNGRLEAVPDDLDRRQRMVRLDEVLAASNAAGRSRRELPHRDALPIGVAAPAPQLRNHRSLIDRTLERISQQHRSLGAELFPPEAEPPTLEQLRQGRLGQLLDGLARAAEGSLDAVPKRVLENVDRLLEILFWSVWADDYSVPWSFWDEPLGELVAKAKINAYGSDQLISVDAAAAELGVIPALLYQMIENREIDHIHDRRTDQTLVPRSSLDHWKQPKPISNKSFEAAKQHLVESGLFQAVYEIEERRRQMSEKHRGLSLEPPRDLWYESLIRQFMEYPEANPPSRRDLLRLRQLLEFPASVLLEFDEDGL